MTVDFLIGAVRASDLHPQVKTELEEILYRQEVLLQGREPGEILSDKEKEAREAWNELLRRVSEAR